MNCPVLIPGCTFPGRVGGFTLYLVYMKAIGLLIWILLLWTGISQAQNKYGLKTVDLPAYRKLIREDSSQEIVSLAAFIPGIRLDIRYATNNNLMHRPVYSRAEAFLRRPAAGALKAAEEEVRGFGYGIKVFDGYRPYRVTVQFYEAYHDSNFVASPYSGSRHNRGCAVDLTLYDLKTGVDLVMPTPYDSFTKAAAADYPDIPELVKHNRKLLQDVMLRHGFVIYASEWWHFDFAGWKKYAVTDIPFEELH